MIGMNNAKLVVMLTYNDKTVSNAVEIFEQCRNSKAEFWGFKEAPLPIDEMKKLFNYMKECGKTTFLEVVEYTEEKCLAGANIAVECGVDYLMGTMYFDSINELCKKNGIKYMPFVGKIKERPSILEGSIDEMIEEANRLIEKGVFGFDLLGYRYVGDALELNRRFISEVKAPVCLAGSVNSVQRLDEIKSVTPWSFTIGSAFFDKCFGDSFSDQIDFVFDYMNE